VSDYHQDCFLTLVFRQRSSITDGWTHLSCWISLRAQSDAFSRTCIYIVQLFAHRDCSCMTFGALQNNDKVAVNHVTRDFRVRLPRSQIIRLTKGTVEEYDKMCHVKKPSSELQAYVIVFCTHCDSQVVWHFCTVWTSSLELAGLVPSHFTVSNPSQVFHTRASVH